jgi:predicted Fe-Mo cluster-binding NifX family protein
VAQVEKDGRGERMIFHHEHKVAVATVNGKAIAPHFGSAPLFVVYTVRKGKILEKDLRVNRRECSRSMEDTQAGCWELMEEMLPDVRAVICRGMGENAYVGLLRRDVLPITTDEEDAEEAIAAYLRDSLKDNPHRVHRPKRDGWCEDDREEAGMMKGDATDLDNM